MRALFDELRRNPDIIAVVVLSLLLGVAPRAGFETAVWDGRDGSGALVIEFYSGEDHQRAKNILGAIAAEGKA